MSDVEARLRQALAEGLEPVAADPGRAAAAIRRARRGRVVRGAATGLVAVLLAGAAATAWERGPDDRPPPAGDPEKVATFALDFETGDGTLTVDVPKAQVCVDLARSIPPLGTRLLYDAAGGADPVVATLGHPDRPLSPQCRPVDPSDAARVVAEPHRHRVSLPKEFVTATSTLEPIDTAPESAPDVLKIVCSQDGAVALTPLVQPQRDGVHLRIYNQAGAWKVFSMTSPDAGGSSGGGLPRRRVLTDAGNIPPGPHLIGCFRDDDSVPYGDPSHPDYASFTVVDPADQWIDPELDCGVGRRRPEIVTDRPTRGAAEPQDFEALIREHVPGLRDDDAIVRATYPESAAKQEHRTVVRDGRKVATLYQTIDEDPDAPLEYVWSILPYVCPGSGIGGD